MALNTLKKAPSLYKYVRLHPLCIAHCVFAEQLIIAASPAVVFRSDRDVNPTVATSVQSFYDTHEAHDLAAHMKKRGNAVTTLKSATPRFRVIGESAGPGAYSPEKVRASTDGRGDERPRFTLVWLCVRARC